MNPAVGPSPQGQSPSPSLSPSGQSPSPSGVSPNPLYQSLSLSPSPVGQSLSPQVQQKSERVRTWVLSPTIEKCFILTPLLIIFAEPCIDNW